jgi:hypothetical protein
MATQQTHDELIHMYLLLVLANNAFAPFESFEEGNELHGLILHILALYPRTIPVHKEPASQILRNAIFDCYVSRLRVDLSIPWVPSKVAFSVFGAFVYPSTQNLTMLLEMLIRLRLDRSSMS